MKERENFFDFLFIGSWGYPIGASVITPPQSECRKKGQNAGNHRAYSEKQTSRRKFLRFRIFHSDFL